MVSRIEDDIVLLRLGEEVILTWRKQRRIHRVGLWCISKIPLAKKKKKLESPFRVWGKTQPSHGKSIKGWGGHEKVKKKDKMECFGCKDKELSRKSGKLHMHNPITYNNRTRCSGTQLRKHELVGRKAVLTRFCKMEKKWSSIWRGGTKMNKGTGNNRCHCVCQAPCWASYLYYHFLFCNWVREVLFPFYEYKTEIQES